MGLPTKRVKDKTNSFPIRPLTVYVLADSGRETDFYRFKLEINTPPLSLLPIDYIYVNRDRNKWNLHKRVNSIFKELGNCNVITRDIEIEEGADIADQDVSKDYCVGYICGNLTWSIFSVGLHMITLELLSDIKNLAEKGLVVPFFISDRLSKDELISCLKRVIDLCDESKAVLFGKSMANLRPKIDEFRHLLDLTTIIRKSPDDFTDEILKTSFEEGRIASNKYGIQVKKLDGKNKYRIALSIDDKLYYIKSTEQSVILFLCAIAFTYRDMALTKKLLVSGNVEDPDKIKFRGIRREQLEIMDICYCALKGIPIGDLKSILDQPNIGRIQLSREFMDFYKKIGSNSHGEPDEHSITTIISRYNKRIIPQTLGEMPSEVYDMFSIRYIQDEKNSRYELSIPKDNIVIE